MPEKFGSSPESKEILSKPITFHVAEHGLETSIDEILSDEDFNKRDKEDFEPNRNWYSVDVATEEDKNKWVDLRNKWLNLAWTPNQDSDTREENADKMRKIEQKMRELENKVRTKE